MTGKRTLSNCHGGAKNLLFRADTRKLAAPMRRESDTSHGRRTGLGRRARDRILSGQGGTGRFLKERPELADLVLFLDEDLRESALAVGGIEAFLCEAQSLLQKADLAPDELRRLLDDPRVGERIALLEDALHSLRRSMGIICATLK